MLLAEVQLAINENEQALASCIEAVQLATSSRTALPFMLAGAGVTRLLRAVAQNGDGRWEKRPFGLPSCFCSGGVSVILLPRSPKQPNRWLSHSASAS